MRPTPARRIGPNAGLTTVSTRGRRARDDATAPTAAAAAAATVVEACRAINRALRVADGGGHRGSRLPPAQAHALRSLGAGPARSLAELAARTQTDPSSASVVVHRLVALGLVARSRAADDRRRVELALTAAGRTRLRHLRPTAEALLRDALVRLAPSDVADLGRLLPRLAATLRELAPAPESDAGPAHHAARRQRSARR